MVFIKGGEYENISPEQMQQVIQKFSNWAKLLRENGSLVHADKINNDGRILTAKDGSISDKPFVKTKESVGGYYLIKAADYEAAVKICKSCPAMEYNGTVEIRKIFDYS